jgi:hypothetical protein
MQAMICKGNERIPVEVTGLDDPRLAQLIDTHGRSSVLVDGQPIPDPDAVVEAADPDAVSIEFGGATSPAPEATTEATEQAQEAPGA